MSEVIDATNGLSESYLVRVVDAVRSGALAVIPTDTSYAVICDAFHAAAITALRIAKNQKGMTKLPIGAASIETAMGVARLSTVAQDLARAFWPGSLTLLTAEQPGLAWSLGNPDHALAVRVPKHETAQLILGRIGPTVMTGAQQAGGHPILEIAHARESLGESVAFYVDGGSLSGTASSVIDASSDNLRLVRSGELTIESIRNVVPSVINALA
jgi:tRNA threonylcarbamoyl adenosine modification protein (Sua5/YciO/YrdC/YwlC family)